jgi:hypothetical protein
MGTSGRRSWWLVLALVAPPLTASYGQETSLPANTPLPSDPTPVPAGIEVQARGPVHEAFATPTAEPIPTTPVPKQPPKALDEMPPAQKPEGNVLWIGGYWAWDDDRKDFLWVSGIWRTVPPGKRWVAGYWRETGGQWQWAPGFWATVRAEKPDQEVSYLPPPPPPPEVAHPGNAPTPESFYVPGSWTWTDNHYVWQAGYWAQVQPGYVWVPAHLRWTPAGYLYIPGYWDMAVERRGVLYAPIVVNHAVVGASFVYTPAYVVRETLVVDSLFVRPRYCHYYFGDYYGPAYRDLGFESCVVYSRRHYEPIIVYARWEHRAEPHWETHQLDICLARHSGRAPLPPRTLVQQNVVIQQNLTNVNVVNNTTNVYQNTVVKNGLVPTTQLAAVKNVKTVTLDPAMRAQAREQAQVVQQVSAQRSQTERQAPAGGSGPRVATLSVPVAKPLKSEQVHVSAALEKSLPHVPEAQPHESVGGKPSITTPGPVAMHRPPVVPLPPAPHPAPPAGSKPATTLIQPGPVTPLGTKPPVVLPGGHMPTTPPGSKPPSGSVPPRPQPHPMPTKPDNPPKQGEPKPNG